MTDASASGSASLMALNNGRCSEGNISANACRDKTCLWLGGERFPLFETSSDDDHSSPKKVVKIHYTKVPVAVETLSQDRGHSVTKVLTLSFVKATKPKAADEMSSQTVVAMETPSRDVSGQEIDSIAPAEQDKCAEKTRISRKKGPPRKVKRSSRFQCRFCGLGFAFRHKLVAHEVGYHGAKVEPSTWNCNGCSLQFAERLELVLHQRIHGNTMMKCSVCLRGFIDFIPRQGTEEEDNVDPIAHAQLGSGEHPTSSLKSASTITGLALEPGSMRSGTSRPPGSSNHFDQPNMPMKPGEAGGRQRMADRPCQAVPAPAGQPNLLCHFCNDRFLLPWQREHHELTAHGEFCVPRLFKCDACDEEFLRVRQLKAHKRTHSNNPLYSCDVCARQYLNRGSLERHTAEHQMETLRKQKQTANDISDDNATDFGVPSDDAASQNLAHRKKYKCAICQASFVHDSGLSRHKRAKHSQQTSAAKPLVECAVCSIPCGTFRNYAVHFAQAHATADCSFAVQRLHFENKQAFLDWKEAAEVAAAVSFQATRGNKVNSRNALHGYYQCTCSGLARSRGVGKRNRDNRKINANCPAFIKFVVAENGETWVECCLNHYGHPTKPGLLPMPSSVRLDNAKQVGEGLEHSAQAVVAPALPGLAPARPAEAVSLSGSTTESVKLAGSAIQLRTSTRLATVNKAKTGIREQEIASASPSKVVSKKMRCFFCEWRFETAAQRNAHELTAHVTQGKRFSCRVCKFKFETRHGCQRHQQHAKCSAPEKPFKCSLCPISFDNEQALKKHRRKHLRKVVSCPHCPLTFQAMRYLYRHMRSEHPPEPTLTEADLEGETSPPAKRATIARSHLNARIRSRLLRCWFCPLSFEPADDRNVHEWQHVKEGKRFVCQPCCREFASRYAWRKHQRTHPTSAEQFALPTPRVKRGRPVKADSTETAKASIPSPGCLCGLCRLGIPLDTTSNYGRLLLRKQWCLDQSCTDELVSIVMASKPFLELPCPHCLLTFPKRALYQHVLFRHVLHPEDDHQDANNLDVTDGVVCQVCGELLPSVAARRQHEAVEHPEAAMFAFSGSVPVADTRRFCPNRSIDIDRPSPSNHPRSKVCQYCQMRFSDEKLRYAHEKEVHLTCEACGVRFNRTSTKALHVCPMQDEVFDAAAMLEENTMQRQDVVVKEEVVADNGEPKTCYLCNKSFKSARLCTLHEKTHRLFESSPLSPERTTSKKHTCQRCRAVFPDVRSLVTHRYSVHRPRSRIINTVVVDQPPLSEDHMKEATIAANSTLFGGGHVIQADSNEIEGERHACQVCSFTFTDASELRLHERMAHNLHGGLQLGHVGVKVEKPSTGYSTASQCRKRNAAIAAMKEDPSIVSMEAELLGLKCRFCPKTFRSKEGRRNHEKRNACAFIAAKFSAPQMNATITERPGSSAQQTTPGQVPRNDIRTLGKVFRCQRGCVRVFGSVQALMDHYEAEHAANRRTNMESTMLEVAEQSKATNVTPGRYLLSSGEVIGVLGGAEQSTRSQSNSSSEESQRLSDHRFDSLTAPASISSAPRQSEGQASASRDHGLVSPLQKLLSTIVKQENRDHAYPDATGHNTGSASQRTGPDMAASLTSAILPGIVKEEVEEEIPAQVDSRHPATECRSRVDGSKPEKPISNRLECEVCHATFISEAGLQRHALCAHPIYADRRELICRYCLRRFLTPEKREEHEILHKQRNPTLEPIGDSDVSWPFHCKICNWGSLTSNDAVKHYESVHYPQATNRVSNSRGLIGIQRFGSTGGPPRRSFYPWRTLYPCEECGEVLGSLSSHSAHMREVHSRESTANSHEPSASNVTDIALPAISYSFEAEHSARFLDKDVKEETMDVE